MQWQNYGTAVTVDGNTRGGALQRRIY